MENDIGGKKKFRNPFTTKSSLPPPPPNPQPPQKWHQWRPFSSVRLSGEHQKKRGTFPVIISHFKRRFAVSFLSLIVSKRRKRTMRRKYRLSTKKLFFWQQFFYSLLKQLKKLLYCSKVDTKLLSIICRAFSTSRRWTWKNLGRPVVMARHKDTPLTSPTPGETSAISI